MLVKDAINSKYKIEIVTNKSKLKGVYLIKVIYKDKRKYSRWGVIKNITTLENINNIKLV